MGLPKAFSGEHDFRSFCALRDPNRSITRAAATALFLRSSLSRSCPKRFASGSRRAKTCLQQPRTTLEIYSEALVACRMTLEVCSVALEVCGVALVACRVALEACSVALVASSVTLEVCGQGPEQGT